MCFLRQVYYVYTKCGHGYPMPDQQVQCDNPRCKFSTTHPKGCYGATCKQSCWQYRQHPQQYSPQVAELCPKCLGKHR